MMATPQKDSKGALRTNLTAEWLALHENCPPDSTSLLLSRLAAKREELITAYLSYLSSEPELLNVLPDEADRIALTNEFVSWTEGLLRTNNQSPEEIFARQDETGRQLARIGMPPFAVSRGMRLLKLWLIHQLAELELPSSKFVGIVMYIIGLFDIALELRECGYDEAITRQARVDEAYRFHLLGQNLAMERERQRALLMEWGHLLLRHIYQAPQSEALPQIWHAEFGQWIDHKARVLFEEGPSLKEIDTIMDRIDGTLLPALEAARGTETQLVTELMRQVDTAMEELKFILGMLFESHIEIENGRDQLTRLLNRRFLPSVLMREIFLQKRGHNAGFCVLLVDIDHFKQVNDEHGHKVGDAVLHHVAALVSASVRPMDFVFRYGGEEIVIVVVDCTAKTGEQIARRILHDIQNSAITLPENRELNVTVSIGLTTHHHDIDYETILARADTAMYRAKAAGRNRLAMEPSEPALSVT